MLRFVVIAAFVAAFTAGALLAKGNIFISGEKAFQKGDYATAFRKLASEDSAQAQYYMGCIYAAGLGGVKKDKAEAAAWLKKAAAQGHDKALFDLGVMASKGEGLPLDKRAALDYYLKAAEKGNSKAQFNLGIMYGTGDGVEKNVNEGYRWIKQAADSGNPAAQKALAVIPKP